MKVEINILPCPARAVTLKSGASRLVYTALSGADPVSVSVPSTAPLKSGFCGVVEGGVLPARRPGDIVTVWVR